MSTKNFQEFAAHAANNPVEHIKRYKAEGKRVMGYTCSYVPEEILDAAGFIPVRLLGRAQNIRKADKYLQTYCCSQIRSLLEDFLNYAYAGLDGVIFAHTCDSMQSFHDIFKKNNPDTFVRNVNFPSRIDGDIAYRYTAAEVRRFVKSLEEFAGAPLNQDSLKESVAVYNRNRELLDRLYSLHLSYPDRIPSVMLLHSVLASKFMDKREVNPMLSMYLDTFDAAKPQDNSRKRLTIVGSVNISDEVYNLADEFGATIADDDLCTGRRYFSTPVAEPSLDGITRRYFSRPHCAAKHRDIHSRSRYIAGMAKDLKINGVIFLYLKFCDPHAFDYPYIKEALDAAHVPSQLIEVEQTSARSGQIRTKMQAFMEMLG